MTGEYGKGRKPTGESYIQFSSQDARDRALDKLQGKALSSSKGAKLLMGKSRSDWVRQRNWAMRKSEELTQKKLDKHSMKKQIKFVKSKEFRKIIVGGVDGFVQLPTDAIGTFAKDFGAQLPVVGTGSHGCWQEVYAVCAGASTTS